LAEPAPPLLGHDPRQIGPLNRLMEARLKGHPYVKSAIDMALWDLLGQATGQPVAELLGGRHGNAVELYRHYAALAEARAQASGLATEAGALLDHYRERLVDRSQPVPMLEAVAERDLAYQMSNPVRVLTSGIERRALEPFYMAGKWRMVERVEWWKTYAADTPVLFGHYWRWPTPEAGQGSAFRR